MQRQQIRLVLVMKISRRKSVWCTNKSQRRLARLLSVLFIAIAVSMMMGCANLTQQSQGQIQPPANLRQPCPDLSPLTNGTGGTLLQWGIQSAKQYRECQNKHKKLVEAWPT